MIGFYQDALLQNPILSATPKRFLLPLAGGSKPGSIYLGDPYTATVAAPAAIAATSVSLNQTAEFPASGSAVVYIPGTVPSQITITYTGKTLNSLTGVTGITSALAIGQQIRPNVTWRSRGNLVFLASGSDCPVNVLVSFGLPTLPLASPRSTAFGVAGASYIVAASSIAAGVENALRLDLNVQVLSGVQAEYSNWSVSTGTLFSYPFGDTSVIPAGTGGQTPLAPGYVIRRDQGVALAARVLPANRQVTDTVPGFRLGQYRWRDQDGIDAVSLVPTRWDADVDAIGIDKFVTGIGDGDDLLALNLEEGTGAESNSVFMRIQDGSYFDGPVRYFLPGNPGLEFQSGLDLVHSLASTPATGKPVFVGTWRRDQDGFYSVATSYRYKAGPFVDDGSPQFQMSRAAKTITLNQPLTSQVLFLGALSGSGTDVFDLPVYPIFSIQYAYIALGGDLGTAPLNSFTFDGDNGTVTITSVPGGLYSAGQPVYAVCSPAIAIEYEIAAPEADNRLLPVDLNPAFSGITSGVIYLQHRQLAPVSVSLACDKPMIDIPATYRSIIDLVAYGPVYFNGDFALLSATAYGPVGGEVVPNVTMTVIVDPLTWSGRINYRNPVSEEVTVTTGADGVVNMIYTPEADWGMFIPKIAAAGGLAGTATTILAGDTLVLPEAISISQVWDGTNWLVTPYTVTNNNPVYGMIGADTTRGQVPWIASGTPGTPAYKTNGQLVAWQGLDATPLKALDAAGRAHTDSLFSGEVVALVYAQAVPSLNNTAAYFLTFLQRVQIKLMVNGTGVFSNLVLLQMADPLLIVEDPWLIIGDAVQGYIGQYRLGQSNDGSISGPTG